MSNMSRAPCKFYANGYCRYGNTCKFEHVDPGANRFSAFNPLSKDLPFSLSREQLVKDLTEERPQWILSAYGPGRDAPEQLFGGYPREQSFEEVRLMHLQGVLMGNPQGALNEIEGLYRESENQIRNALQNPDAALQFIIDSQNNPQNRTKMVQNNMTGMFAVGRQPQGANNPFGAANNNNAGQSAAAAPFGGGGGLGQPSALGQKPGAFGNPAFGQPVQPTSAFGRPAQPTSAFGQPSALGDGTSAFGQPSALGGGGGGSAFGQPSALGQRPSTFGAPAFGQPSAPSGFGQPSTLGGGGGGGVFGQPSALGQTQSPFGQGLQTSNPSPFGAAAGAANPAGGSAFGQPSALGGGGFGQPSVLGQTRSPFGAPAATAVTPFGQPVQQQQQQQQQQPQNPFGAPGPSAPQQAMDMSISMSDTTPTATSAFGQPSAAPAAVPNPFQQAQQQQQQAAATNPFGQPSSGPTMGGFGAPAAPQQQQQQQPGGGGGHPPLSSYATKTPDGRTLLAFKGKAVTYLPLRDGGGKEYPAMRNFDGSSVRIWNPDGPPPYYRDTEAADPTAYDDRVRADYAAFLRTGRFEGGVVPEVPPLREWCAWDF